MTSGEPSGCDDTDPRLSALIADYTLMREDERQHPLAIAALFTILVAVVFAEASQILSGCGTASSCTKIPGAVFAIAPAPVYAVLAMTVLIGAEATMRYAYMVALEQELEERLPETKLAMLDCPSFSWQRARAPLVIFKAGPAQRFPFPYLYIVMLAPLVLIAVALTVYCMAQVTPLGVQIAVSLVYGATAALLVFGTVRAWRAQLWQPWPWKSNEFVRAAIRRSRVE